MSERSGTFIRRCAAVAATLTIAIALAGCNRLAVHAAATASSSKSAPPTVTERQIIDAVNRYRAVHGRGALSVSANLSVKAELWSAWMAGGHCGHASDGTPAICHSNLTSGVTAGWSLLEENVGAASPKTNVAGLVAGFEHSPEHAANMLNTRITAIGVGVAYSGNTIYVAEEFMAR